MLLLNMSNRGWNLWCVEKAFIGLTPGQETYITPDGTLDILNVVFSQPTLSAATFATTVEGGMATLTDPATILRVGFTVSAPFTGVLAVSTSSDDVTYVPSVSLPRQSYAVGQQYWADLPVAALLTYVKVESVAAPYPALSSIVAANRIYDLPLTPWNRDTYLAINNKRSPGRPSTSYFYEKKLTPTITIWPVPTTGNDHLTVYRHRQPQDVGSLTQQLEIPQRWLDGFIWLLAARFCFELPSIEDSVVQRVVQMADKQVFEAELSETDNMPTYFTPNIGPYSR